MGLGDTLEVLGLEEGSGGRASSYSVSEFVAGAFSALVVRLREVQAKTFLSMSWWVLGLSSRHGASE